MLFAFRFEFPNPLERDGRFAIDLVDYFATNCIGEISHMIKIQGAASVQTGMPVQWSVEHV